MSIAAYTAWLQHADNTGQLRIDIERHMRQPELHAACAAVCYLADIPEDRTTCVTIYRDSAVIEYLEHNADGRFFVRNDEVAAAVKSIPLTTRSTT